MYLSASHVYSAPADVVFGMLNDPEFRRYSAGFMGADEVEVIGERLVAVLEAPRDLRGLTGSSLTLEQVVSWHQAGPGGVRTGDLQVTLVGVPMSLSALVRLVPETDGTLVDYSGDLTIKIPIMGRFLEQQAAPFIVEALDAQHQAGIYWLSR